MNSSQSVNIFCPKHSDCLAPISVITDILSENDPVKFEQISIEFDQLGFTKVQDLANASLGKASSIKLCGDSLTLLYGAIEQYSVQLDRLLECARFNSRIGNYVKTQEMCLDYLKQKPGNVDVLILFSHALFHRKDYDTCINYLEIAKSIKPNCCEIIMNLGLCFWEKSKNDEAKLLISTACGLKKARVNNFIAYADFLIQTKQYALAQFLYDHILNVRPTLSHVHNKYGKLLFLTNQIEDAERRFKIALDIAPQYQDCLNNLADLYFKTGKFDKAISTYEKVLAVNSNHVTALVNLGITYIKVKEYQKAFNVFQRAIKLEPKNISALRNLAVVYCHQLNMELSVETFKKCLKFEPDNFDINKELALINFHNLENWQEAKYYLKKCIQLNSKRKDLYMNLFSVYQKSNEYLNASNVCLSLGDLYLDDGDNDNARNAFNCAVYLNPSNAFGHWKAGLAFYKLGHSDLALIRFQKSIYLNPGLSKAYIDCGVIFEETGKLDMALKYYQMAIRLEPGVDNALENLKDLQDKMGEIDEDMKALEINDKSVKITELTE